ncbi:hypothetical protein [Clostridium tyrobutyricum]|uniref:hypothetical protein n=1 Tax=Clostridium tyrobutyricum TaxID=1519 RepID=UPI00057D873B|nr:hypothetical protein [Clostridium tyrobutyricum]
MNALVENSKNEIKTNVIQSLILKTVENISCSTMKDKNSRNFYKLNYSKNESYNIHKNRNDFSNIEKTLYKMLNNGTINNKQYDTLIQYFLAAYIEKEFSNKLTMFFEKSFSKIFRR